MKRVPMAFHEDFDRLCSALQDKGALLVVEDRHGKPNVMTIGWGTVGVIWRRPVFGVLVRPSRYTHDLLREAETFSVNVPDHDLEEALETCGSRTGREVDKFELGHLTAVKGLLSGTTVVGEAKWFYECRILHRNDVEGASLPREILNQYYPSSDFHTVYFGEILHAYRRSPTP